MSWSFRYEIMELELPKNIRSGSLNVFTEFIRSAAANWEGLAWDWRLSNMLPNCTEAKQFLKARKEKGAASELFFLVKSLSCDIVYTGVIVRVAPVLQ